MLGVPRALIPALVTLALAGAPAFAHGHGGHHGGHGRIHGGGFHHRHGGFFFFHPNPFWFGEPVFVPRPYAYEYYAPGADVVPSPLYSVPVPGQCRVFQGDALIAGTTQPFFGTACWQPDGAWHVMP